MAAIGCEQLDLLMESLSMRLPGSTALEGDRKGGEATSGQLSSPPDEPPRPPTLRPEIRVGQVLCRAARTGHTDDSRQGPVVSGNAQHARHRLAEGIDEGDRPHLQSVFFRRVTQLEVDSLRQLLYPQELQQLGTYVSSGDRLRVYRTDIGRDQWLI
jgi:hypothetical protein